MKLATLCTILTLCCSSSAFAQSKAPDATPAPKKESPIAPSGLSGLINLRPKFKAGQVNKFKMVMNSKGQQVSPAGTGIGATGTTTESQNMSQEIGIALTVKETNKETGTVLEVAFESFKIKMKTPDGQDVEFDSNAGKKGEADPVAEVLKSLLDMKMTIKMDKDGNITQTDGGGGLGALTGALGGGGDGQLGGAGNFSAADLFKNLLGPVSSDKKGTGEAKVGQSWTNEDRIKAAWGNIKMITKQTLTSHRGGIATLDMNGTFQLEPESATSPVPAIRESVFTGRTLWNTESGMLSEMTVKQKLVLEGAKTGKSVQEMDVKVSQTK